MDWFSKINDLIRSNAPVTGFIALICLTLIAYKAVDALWDIANELRDIKSELKNLSDKKQSKQ